MSIGAQDNAALDGLEADLLFAINRVGHPESAIRKEAHKRLEALRLLRRLHAALNPSDNEIALLQLKAAVFDEAASMKITGDEPLRAIGAKFFELVIESVAYQRSKS